MQFIVGVCACAVVGTAWALAGLGVGSGHIFRASHIVFVVGEDVRAGIDWFMCVEELGGGFFVPVFWLGVVGWQNCGLVVAMVVEVMWFADDELGLVVWLRGLLW